MKLFRKTLAALSAVCVFAAFSAVVTPAGAAVTISDGTFEYTYSAGEWQLYSYVGDGGEVTLPKAFDGEPVTKICGDCFFESGVTSVTIPEGYTSIGSYAFYGCEALTEITLPSSIESVGIGAFSKSGVVSADFSASGIDAVESYTFLNCASLKSVKLPKTVTAIGEMAFSQTTALETAELNNGLKSIGESSFEGSAIGELDLPETVESIGASAFRNSGLTRVYIPEAVSSIGAYALFPMSVQGAVTAEYFSGTYAEEYCYENFVTNIKAYAKISGDSNLDGKLNIDDVTAIQRHCAKIDIFSAPAKVLADVSHNGAVSIEDVTLLQRYLCDFSDAVI